MMAWRHRTADANDGNGECNTGTKSADEIIEEAANQPGPGGSAVDPITEIYALPMDPRESRVREQGLLRKIREWGKKAGASDEELARLGV